MSFILFKHTLGIGSGFQVSFFVGSWLVTCWAANSVMSQDDVNTTLKKAPLAIASVASEILSDDSRADDDQKPNLPEISDEPKFIEEGRFMPERLAQPTTVDFRRSSLNELVEWLRKDQNLTVLVELKELSDLGILPGDSVSDWLDNAPLYLLLDRLSNMGIGWYYQNDVVYLTDKKVVKERMVTSTFNLGGLLDVGFATDGIVELLEAVVEPSLWEVDGGEGRISVVGDMMFIRGTDHLQRQVQGLLTGLLIHGRQTYTLDTAANVVLRQRLGSEVSVSFVDTPLDEVISTLAKVSSADIRLDLRALSSTRIRVRQPITLTIANGRLDTILNYLMKELGLQWMIRDGVLWVTDSASASKNYRTAIYDVRDLCANADEADALRDAIIAQTPEVWSESGLESNLLFPKPGTMVVWSEDTLHAELLELLEKYRSALRSSKSRTPEKQDDPITTVYYRMHADVADGLQTILQTLIAPDSWQSQENAGAIGTLAVLPSNPDLELLAKAKTAGSAAETAWLAKQKVLIITQKQSIHDQIAELLRRVENGDPFARNSMGGMGGMGGGFGGMFAIPESSARKVKSGD